MCGGGVDRELILGVFTVPSEVRKYSESISLSAGESTVANLAFGGITNAPAIEAAGDSGGGDLASTKAEAITAPNPPLFESSSNTLSCEAMTKKLQYKTTCFVLPGLCVCGGTS